MGEGRVLLEYLRTRQSLQDLDRLIGASDLPASGFEPNLDLPLRDLEFANMFDVARESGIPLQANVLTGYGEDGAEIQRFDSGRPSVNITVPTRYLHSHTGVIQRSDFDQAVDLLIAALRRLDRETVNELASFR